MGFAKRRDGGIIKENPFTVVVNCSRTFKHFAKWVNAMNEQNYIILSDDTDKTEALLSLSKDDEKKIDAIIQKAIDESKNNKRSDGV